jgi:polysaccharide export outer membrane protein
MAGYNFNCLYSVFEIANTPLNFVKAGFARLIAPAINLYYQYFMMKMFINRLALICFAVLATGCTTSEPSEAVLQSQGSTAIYRIGPLDGLEVFVWRMPELSRGVTVRPDGRISMPLIDDLVATGKTPTQLARDIETQLRKFVQDPTVTVIVAGFHGPFNQQVRIVGEATDPQAIPYQANMTVLDVMIAVHGLTKFAAGNRAELVRTVNGKEAVINVHIDDLIKDGDIDANVPVQPGDVLIIPQAWF